MKTKINRSLENKFYVILLIIVSLLFAIFLTSKMWMYDDNPIMQTPFFTEINGLDQTVLVLHKWEYNPENELMEVALETKHKGTDHIKPTLSFAAKERGSLVNYPVEVVYREGEHLILQIKDVPNNYRIIGLFVKETRDKKMLEHEMKLSLLESNLESEVSELELPKPKEIIIIGDYRKIKINKDLKMKDNTSYQIEQIEREINQLDQKLKLLKEESIPLQEQIIVSIKKDIQGIEDEMKYKTETEKRDAEVEIKAKHDAIKKAMKKKEEYENEIIILQEKKEKLLEKMQDIKHNKNEKSINENVQSK